MVREISQSLLRLREYATLKLGEMDMKTWANDIARVIRAVRADQTSLTLQNQFYQESQHPLDTEQ